MGDLSPAFYSRLRICIARQLCIELRDYWSLIIHRVDNLEPRPVYLAIYLCFIFISQSVVSNYTSVLFILRCEVHIVDVTMS